MREELGDVLLQSVFQARVCESDAEDPFDIDEVADRLVNKLITRHPHVFAADDVADSSDADGNGGEAASQSESPEAVLALWEKMKQQEKHRKSVLEGISRAQGALPRAAKVVSRISKSPNADELSSASTQQDVEQTQAANQSESNGGNSVERGKADAYADEIFAIVREARTDGIDIEAALRNRLRDIEEKVALIESEINNG